jgi:hypothetical protein
MMQFEVHRVAPWADLWETVRMAKQRQLVPLNKVGAAPFGYKCDQCSRVFRVGNLNDEETQRKIRAEFEAHNCKEDASQAAARIVREATEDH